jgi:hypothetical protein
VNLPLRRLLACVLVITALSACEDPNFGRAVLAENHTNSSLMFETIVDGQTYPILGNADPGERVVILAWAQFNNEHSLITEDECTIGDVVALDPEGREVARHPPPLCLDEVWVIEAGD